MQQKSSWDKNSTIGIILIMLIFIGYTIWQMPSEEERQAMKRKQDSIARIDSIKKTQEVDKQVTATASDSIQAITETPTTSVEVPDSVKSERLKSAYGAFFAAAEGEQEFFTLENDLMKVTLTNKGGRVYSVELKGYQTYDSLPLMIFEGDTNQFNLSFSHYNRELSTQDFYFEPFETAVQVSGEDSSSVSMRLYADNGGYLEYVYQIKGDKYLVDFDLNLVNLNQIVDNSDNSLDFNWAIKLPQQEKSLDNERMQSCIYFKERESEDVDYLSGRGTESDDLIEEQTNWIALKNQFFSSIIVSEQGFQKDTKIKAAYEEEADYVKMLSAKFSLPYEQKEIANYDMAFYFGPNHYQTLKKYGRNFEEIIPLGWGIFGWINRFAVIPVFNFLNGFNLNYGIIILILTVLLKIVLLPIAYKSYQSSAKMRVLKPEIAELNKKYEGKDPMEKQQATMSLYRKAGVNPLAGCIPAVLQMPILIAMFRFFPASIELRQQPFLWADDLSSYDSIMDLPFEIPFYGDHVSLFTLLMTVSTIIYTRMNSSMQMGAGGGEMQKQMQWMMYLMPIMFLGFFNSYASGLSYYYFLANVITFSQHFLFRQLIDEDALHQKIQENKKKPSKKSNFQKKLEDMAKQQGYNMPRNQRRKKGDKK